MNQSTGGPEREFSNKGHVIELMGGLGNQLFQLVAARQLLPNPIFDISMAIWPLNHHPNSSVLPLIHEERESARACGSLVGKFPYQSALKR